MRTYTLDQLTRFTDIGMERLAMLRAMQALGMDEDACFALPPSPPRQLFKGTLR